jgi:hypothetical protein
MTIDNNNNDIMFPEHDYVKFLVSKNAPKGYCVAGIRTDQVDDTLFQFLVEFFDDNFKRVAKDTIQWYVKSEETNDILSTIDDALERQEEDGEDDESEDELIQASLARRFKYQSEGKVYEDEEVTESDDECVLSLSRRLRHIYKEIKMLRMEVEQLKREK